MASTQPQFQPDTEDGYDVRFTSLDTGEIIYDGTMAMNVAGNAQPFTDTGYEAGAKFLGCSTGTYDNRTGSAPLTIPMTFRRGCVRLVPEVKTGDVPTANDVGGSISLADDNTTKKTVGGSDISVTLVHIMEDGSGLKVRLP